MTLNKESGELEIPLDISANLTPKRLPKSNINLSSFKNFLNENNTSGLIVFVDCRVDLEWMTTGDDNSFYLDDKFFYEYLDGRFYIYLGPTAINNQKLYYIIYNPSTENIVAYYQAKHRNVTAIRMAGYAEYSQIIIWN